MTVEASKNYNKEQTLTWIEVRNGINLPEIDQSIIFLEDLRGTQDGYYSRIPDKTRPLLFTRHGWVSSIGFSNETKEWWLQVRATAARGLGIFNGHPDHVTHWMPMPLPFSAPRSDWYAIEAIKYNHND